MKPSKSATLIMFALCFAGLSAAIHSSAASPEVGPPSKDETSKPVVRESATLDEARSRARLLHEAFHATLRIVHRRYYREDEGLKIPSSTLDEVFAALAPRCNIQLRWLAVNSPPMNIDHAPQDEFEKRAIRALAAGKEEFELLEGSLYRHAGAIVLSSECLKCHVPNRTSTEDRIAALLITMPIKGK